ncbi:hypothetical protein ACEOWJ_001421 [Bacillus cereus]|uniref:hypothetical protein n=1 Tax=Bacillus TaxID=1386 RepID=UPI000550872B|nr:hypothetical protein [Bacillus sp. UNC322MFChir4.1]
MVIKRLNAAAIEAKTDEAVMWEIKTYYIPLIERLAFENWYKMNNETHFIDDCNRKIDYAIRTFNIHKGNFDRRVRWLLNQSVRQYCGNRGKQRKVLQLIGEELDALKILDNTVNVEEEAIKAVIKEEMYANCDRGIDAQILDIIFDKKDHVENQSEITRKLAEKTGRSFDSARGAVRSFAKRKRAV